MNSIIGIRNFFMRIGYQILRPVIFLMDPEEAHYSLKRVGVFLGSNSVSYTHLRAHET